MGASLDVISVTNASPAKAATQATVTTKQLAAALAQGDDLPSKQIEAVFERLGRIGNPTP